MTTTSSSSRPDLDTRVDGAAPTQQWPRPSEPTPTPTPTEETPTPAAGSGYGPPPAWTPSTWSTGYGNASGYGSTSGYGSASSSAAPPPVPPSVPPTPSGPPPAPRQRKPRTVLTAVTAAVLAAALASGGTAYLLQDDGGADTASSVELTQVQGIAAQSDGSPDWEAVAADVRPSVVAIDVQMAQGEAAGSGVVLDDQGHVLTNNHVVEGAQAVQVMLWDGTIYEAEVVGTDPTTDLAVLRIVDPPADLEPATLGTSDDVAVGEDVMAVGNPLGLDSTVTTGIVSALDRPVTASSQGASTATVTNAIQIDAAINPGNSGGPLFDSQGLVIGITSSIATLSGGGGESGSIGLGFAIPIDLATSIADQLIEDGQAEHAFLGVTLQEGSGTADGVTRQGAQVVDVSPGTPAADAGLPSGDVIVGIDDHTVGSAESLTGYVRQYPAGGDVTLTVIRDGASSEVAVTLATREED